MKWKVAVSWSWFVGKGQQRWLWLVLEFVFALASWSIVALWLLCWSVSVLELLLKKGSWCFWDHWDCNLWHL